MTRPRYVLRTDTAITNPVEHAVRSLYCTGSDSLSFTRMSTEISRFNPGQEQKEIDRARVSTTNPGQ